MKLGWESLGKSFACSCGVTHHLPIEVCHVGADAADRLAGFARMCGGRSCLVISDENTWRAGGNPVVEALSRAGMAIVEKVYDPVSLEATEVLGDEVTRLAGKADFIVGIGSGTLCDLAKYAGNHWKRPVLLFATAASMNGYTSSIVALKVRGLKRTLPCAPALGVFADPAVVATAPVRMAAAGVGDFLSKVSSASDWYMAHVLRGDYYCERPGEFVEGIQDRVLAVADGVGAGKPEAIQVVLEALLLAGFSMVMAGSSAPASGGEHLISHYLDMKHATRGTRHDLHGAQVGVATVYTLELWEKVLALDPEKLEVDALIDRQPDESQVDEGIREDWGPVADEVLAQWHAKRLSRDALRDELVRFQQGLPEWRSRIARELLPASIVAEAIRRAGGPALPEALDVPGDEYRKALKHARYLRNRFTILDLAAETGIAG